MTLAATAPSLVQALTQAFGPKSGAAKRLGQIALMAFGILVLAVAAKIRVPMWPVPITMGTFAVPPLGPQHRTPRQHRSTPTPQHAKSECGTPASAPAQQHAKPERITQKTS